MVKMKILTEPKKEGPGHDVVFDVEVLELPPRQPADVPIKVGSVLTVRTMPEKIMGASVGSIIRATRVAFAAGKWDLIEPENVPME